MDLQSMGKWLLLLGAALAVIGLMFWLGGRLGLGALPGDIKVQRQGATCFVPIVSSIVVSLLLTIILNLLLRWFR